MMDRSKALQKYLSKNSKSEQTNKVNKNQVKIFDPDLEDKKSDFSEEEDVLPLMENSAGLGLGEREKRELIKKGFLKTKKEENSDDEQSKINNNKKIGSGQWVQVEKQSALSSSPSPPRRRHDSDSESDQSKPELKEKKEADNFKNLKRTYKEALGINLDINKDCDSDLSPARRQEEDPDEGRKKGGGGPLTIDFSQDKIKKKKKNDEKKGDTQMDINKFAQQFKNAETIYRDKEGKIIQNINDYKGEEEARKEELRKRNEERIGEWGGGAYQKKMQEERKKQIKDLKNQNFANYEISKEREKEMMEQSKFDDPMRKLIEKDKKKEMKTMNIMSIFKKCPFRGVPNRFGIEPGHRWDGVDRSNGYERKYLSSINQRKLEKSQKDSSHLKEM